ncbi:MAG: hypothetical protein LBI45_07055, partial [Bacteroidales bacterium]|nr:hypothetical protein [Bacteroidales bacterium]
MRTKILLFMMLCLPVSMQAYDAFVDGIYYNFSGTEAEVTYGSLWYQDNNLKYIGSVTIPCWANYPVTGIGKQAF